MSQRYRTIVADPPWPYREAFAQIHSRAGRVEKPLPYGAMDIAEIRSIPVDSLAASDCRLFCWTTNRYLPTTFWLLTEWGFRYRQTIVWHKAGNPSPWGGSVAPNHAEYLLVGTRGNPERREMWKSNVMAINVGRHSEKPEAFLDLIEQVSPGPYVELFARRARFGWDYWGDESLQTVELSLAEQAGIDTSVCEICEEPLDDATPWKRGLDGCGAHLWCLGTR